MLSRLRSTAILTRSSIPRKVVSSLFQQDDGHGRSFLGGGALTMPSRAWCHQQSGSGSGSALGEKSTARNQMDLSALRNHPAYRGLFYFYDANQVEKDVEHPAAKAFISQAMSSSESESVICLSDSTALPPLLEALPELKEEEILHVMYHIRNFSLPEDREEWERVWRAFDEDAIRRGVERRKWRAAVNFIYADLWCYLLLGKSSTFHWIFTKICARKVDSLPREKFIRLCNSLLRARKLPKEIKLYNLEYNIPRILNPELNNGRPLLTEELAAISLVFWKNKAPFHDNNIAEEILKICISDFQTISNPSITAICKALCLTQRFRIQDTVLTLLSTMRGELGRLDFSAVASLLTLGRRFRVRHEEFLEDVSQVLYPLYQKNKTKLENVDIVWMLRAYEDLDQKNTKAFQTLWQIVKEDATYFDDRRVEKTKKQEQESEEDIDEDEIPLQEGEKDACCHHHHQPKTLEEKIFSRFGRKVYPVLNSLAAGEIFPRELITLALSEKGLKQSCGKAMQQYNLEVLRVDQGVAAVMKDYSGPRLPERARGYLTKSNMTWVPEPERVKLPGYESMCRSIEESLQKIVGKENIFMTNVLPYFQSIELVFCKDKKTGGFVKVPNGYKEKVPWEPKTLTTEDTLELEFHAICTYYWDKLIGESDEPIGSQSLLKGRLEKMGYKTYEISHSSWKPKSKEEFDESIRKLLNLPLEDEIGIKEAHKST